MRVLIIEDSADVVEAVSLCLQLRWPEVNISSTPEGTEGMEKLFSEPYDIVILDINLPDIDGFQILKRTRAFSDVPIIILTVREHERDQIIGLEMGADDYIVKPFRPRDLVARINTVLRRTQASKGPQKKPSLALGKLTLSLDNNEVRIGEEVVKLTPYECKVLYILMENAGRLISSEAILQEVWGREYKHPYALRTYIQRLRNKLSDKPPKIILNQRGLGYRFVSPK
ncbi:response regulator transcription factor [Chloroflexota bacterium]